MSAAAEHRVPEPTDGVARRDGGARVVERRHHRRDEGVVSGVHGIQRGGPHGRGGVVEQPAERGEPVDVVERGQGEGRPRPQVRVVRPLGRAHRLGEGGACAGIPRGGQGVQRGEPHPRAGVVSEERQLGVVLRRGQGADQLEP